MMVRREADGMTLGLELPWSFESFVERSYEGSKEEEGKKWICPSHFTLWVLFLLYCFFAAKSSSTRSLSTVGEDSVTSTVVPGDSGRDLKLEVLDLLQSVGWAAGSPSSRTWKR